MPVTDDAANPPPVSTPRPPRRRRRGLPRRHRRTRDARRRRATAGTRIVVAEDEALIRLDLAEMLAEDGYDVVGQAGNGEQAVELARELRPTW